MSIFVSSLFPLILAANPGPAPVAPAVVSAPAAVAVKAIQKTQPFGKWSGSGF
jgi:hypothetical protein